MPKLNVYVPDDMLAWIRDNDVKASAEFQQRIREIQGASERSDRRKLGRVRVRGGHVRLKPGAEAIGTEERSDGLYVLYLE